MIRRPPHYMLWHGQEAIVCGTLDDCLRAADERGLLQSDDGAFYSLTDGADIQVYPASGRLGWFVADEVARAVEKA